MEKIDARTQSQDVQEAQRYQIVRLRESGRSNRETSDIVGVSESHCSKVWQRYKKLGPESLSKGQRGRRQGEQRDLTLEQEAEIKKLLIDVLDDLVEPAVLLVDKEARKDRARHR